MINRYDFVNSKQNQVFRLMQDILKSNNNELWESPTTLIHKLRMIKSAAEVELMMKTCRIASDAIADTMAISKPGNLLYINKNF